MKSHDEKVKDYSRIASIRESISGEERIKGVRKRSSAGMKEKEREERSAKKKRGERKRESQDRPLSGTLSISRPSASMRA